MEPGFFEEGKYFFLRNLKSKFDIIDPGLFVIVLNLFTLLFYSQLCSAGSEVLRRLHLRFPPIAIAGRRLPIPDSPGVCRPDARCPATVNLTCSEAFTPPLIRTALCVKAT